MFLTTHAVVGIFISQQTNNPLLAFILAFISHFILDIIPHGDEELGDLARLGKKRIYLWSLGDFFVLVIMIGFLYTTTDLPRIAVTSAGVIGSILPDLISHFFPALHREYPKTLIIKFLLYLDRTLKFGSLFDAPNKLHRLTHRIIKFKIPFKYGMGLQLLIIFIFIFNQLI